MRKIISIITVTAFLLLSSLPLWGHFLPGADDASRENRAFAVFPNSIDGFPEKFEAWFDDHFAFRALMVDAYNAAVVSSGVEIINNVAIGRDGWLYYTADSSYEDMRREARYTEDELAYICARQQECSDYLASLGIDYYLVVCPDKHTVYPEYLPSALAGYTGESRFDSLARALSEDTTVKFVDTRPAVIAEKEEHTVFFKIDTHWNGYGAFAGYTALINRIAEDHPVRVITKDDCDLTLTENWTGGDMAIFLGREDEMTDTKVVFTVNDSRLERLETRYAETSPDPERPIVTLENLAHPELPTAVIFRDSFCRMMYPMLADSFSKVTFVWSTYVIDSIVMCEKPDIVIMEYVERYSGMAGQGMSMPSAKLVDYEAGDIPLPRESASVFSYVDSFDDSRDICTVNGWAFLAGRDSVPGEAHIALKSGDKVVWCSTAAVDRPDVTGAYYPQGDVNVNASGFSAWFDKTALEKGEWELIAVLDNGEEGVYAKLGKKVIIK